MQVRFAAVDEDQVVDILPDLDDFLPLLVHSSP